MAIDFQVVFPQTVVQLNGVRVLQGFSPLTLDVSGEDFRSVDEVLINDVASPEIMVLSRTRLLAQVPPLVANTPLKSVSVISSRLAFTRANLLRFRVGKTASKVSGVLRLMQVFLKLLLTTPGTDIFTPRLGGAALKNLGLTFGKDQGGSIVSDFVVAVSSTQRQIIAIQARDPSLPLDERLLSARVISAGYRREEAALVVSVEITSQAGRSALANVMM